ncbi:hypothetical protein LTR53_003712 [Teratosphaeriaceae sp. CCFEE 6253]|nr:hypothetical protein LTR53_003712 [Teratosphaeriaceae sp. CCFEE 6253]
MSAPSTSSDCQPSSETHFTTAAWSQDPWNLALLQLNRQVYSEYKQRLKKTAALQIEDGGIVPIMTQIRGLLPGLQVVELRLVVHGPYATQACQELAMHQDWVGGLRASLPQVDFHTMLYTPQEPGVLYPRIVWCDRAVHAALQNFINRIMAKSIAVSTFDNADKHREIEPFNYRTAKCKALLKSWTVATGWQEHLQERMNAGAVEQSVTLA